MTYTIERGDTGQSVPDFSPSSTGIPAHVLHSLSRNHIVRQRVEALRDRHDRDLAAKIGQQAISNSRHEDRDRKMDQLAKVKASGAAASVVAEFVAEGQLANRLLEASHAEENRFNGLLGEGSELLNRAAPVLASFHGGVEIPLAKRPTLATPKTSWQADYVLPQRAIRKEAEAEKKRDVVPELDEEIQNARRAVATLARTTKIAFEGSGIKWPMRETVAVEEMLRGPGPWPARFKGIDVEAVLCHLFPDQLTAVLEQSVRDRYDMQNALALSPDEARKRLRDLNARLREAEAIEVEAIWRGLEAGEDLRFRPDTNIRTLLGIAPG